MWSCPATRSALLATQDEPISGNLPPSLAHLLCESLCGEPEKATDLLAIPKGAYVKPFREECKLHGKSVRYNARPHLGFTVLKSSPSKECVEAIVADIVGKTLAEECSGIGGGGGGENSKSRKAARLSG